MKYITARNQIFASTRKKCYKLARHDKEGKDQKKRNKPNFCGLTSHFNPCCHNSNDIPEKTCYKSCSPQIQLLLRAGNNQIAYGTCINMQMGQSYRPSPDSLKVTTLYSRC